jgi:hypothetical protein
MFMQGDIRRQYPPEGALTISEDAGGARTPKIRRRLWRGDHPSGERRCPHEWVPSLGICNIQRPEPRRPPVGVDRGSGLRVEPKNPHWLSPNTPGAGEQIRIDSNMGHK